MATTRSKVFGIRIKNDVLDSFKEQCKRDGKLPSTAIAELITKVVSKRETKVKVTVNLNLDTVAALDEWCAKNDMTRSDRVQALIEESKVYNTVLTPPIPPNEAIISRLIDVYGSREDAEDKLKRLGTAEAWELAKKLSK